MTQKTNGMQADNCKNIEYGMLVKMRNVDTLCIYRVSRIERRNNRLVVSTFTAGSGHGKSVYKTEFWNVFEPLADGDIETLPEWAKDGALVTYKDKYGREYVGRLGHNWTDDNGRRKFTFEGCTLQDYRNACIAYPHYTDVKPLEHPVVARFKEGDRVRITKNGHTGTVKSMDEEIPGTRFMYRVDLDEPIVDLPYCDWYKYVYDEELEAA